jgi:PAS domain S-box-containing protein
MMNSYLAKVIFCGITPGTPFRDARQIALVNRASLITVFTTLLFLLFYSYLGAYELLGWETFFLCSGIAGILLNKIGWQWAAKVYMVLLMSAVIFIKSCHMGPTSYMHHIFYTIISGILLIYDNRQRVASVALILIPIVCLTALEYYNFEFSWFPRLVSLDEQTLLAIRIASFITTISLLVVAGYFYMEDSASQHRSIVKARQLLKAIFDNSYDAIFLVDDKTKLIVNCNQRAVELFEGTDRNAFIGTDGSFLHKHPYTQKDLEKVGRYLERDSKYSKEVEYVTLKGNSFWGNMAITRFRVESSKMYIMRVTDITMRKMQDEKISRSEAALAEAHHMAKIGSFEIDLATENLSFTPEYCTVMGMVNDPANNSQNFLDAVHPEYKEAIKQHFKECIDQKTDFNLEYKFIRPIDGQEIFVKGYGKLTRSESGELVKMLCIVQDITVAKRKEEELIKARQQAEQASRIKEEFLSTMSHEIRTPLNVVIGMTHLLLQEDPKPSQIDNLNTLHFSAGNLLSLVSDILDFNKIEAGKVQFESIQFNLHELVHSIKQSQLQKAQEKGIDVELLISPGVPQFVLGDPVRLSQILYNLANNALKFTEQGKITIKITLQTETPDQVYLRFEVTDTGIGIAEDKIALIFQNFTQASSSTTRKYGGTGLGLAIVKRLLELQNSYISVESQPGKGSCFGFELALSKVNATEQVLRQPAVDMSVHFPADTSLLLVEDNEFNQVVALKFLKLWGITPDVAANGAVAVEMALQKKYQVILMDLQMPEMDGYEATRIIHNSTPQNKDTPIIAFTASAMLEVQQRISSAGFSDYITKPFDPNDLYRKISKFLQPAAPVQAKPKVTTYAINYQKIIEMAKGNTQFEAEFITMYIDSLKEFKKKYKQALLTHDIAALKKLMHNAKVTLTMIEAQALLTEVYNIRTLMENGIPSEDRLEESIQEIEAGCNTMIADLSARLAGLEFTPAEDSDLLAN